MGRSSRLIKSNFATYVLSVGLPGRTLRYANVRGASDAPDSAPPHPPIIPRHSRNNPSHTNLYFRFMVDPFATTVLIAWVPFKNCYCNRHDLSARFCALQGSHAAATLPLRLLQPGKCRNLRVHSVGGDGGDS